MYQSVNVPTHNKGHILDWVILPTVHAFCKNVAVIEKAQSYHFLLIIDLNTHKPPVQKKKILSRKLKDINFERLKQDLILALRSPENIDINDLENILN